MLESIQKSKAGANATELSPLCRFCGHASCDSLGTIADSDMFAGNVTDIPVSGGQLLHCRDCDSLFRYPVLSESEYLALYGSVDSDIWEDDTLRKDQILVRSALSRAISGGKVLDVGCFAGQFLAGLTDSYEKFGIEPSRTAAESAKSKGVHILGTTISDIASETKFDCIVSIDVIEHLLDPVGFFTKAFQLLNPNGFLIISTGNPNSFAWRYIFKSRFWYVTNAEHVSFPSQKFIAEMAKKLGGEVTEVINFRYADIGFKRSMVKLLGQIMYAISPKLYSAIRGTGADGSRYPSIYSLGLFRDHHLIAIRKLY